MLRTCVSFLGMGLLFCGFIVREVYLGAKTYGWQRTECTIVESSVIEDAKSDNPYRFQVRYEYQWQGKTFSSTKRTRQGESGWSDYADARKQVWKFPPDSQTVCYVNPENPSEAILVRSNLWIGLFIFLPLIFVAVGIVGLVAMWSKQVKESDGTSPVRTGPISSVEVKQNGRKIAAWFCGLFFVIGVVASYFLILRPLLEVLSARNWVVTPCTIVSSRVQSHRGDDSTTYRIDILYRYEFNGEEHQSNRYTFMGGSSSGYKRKAEIVRRYPAGMRSTCFVDPRQPQEAVLERGLTRDMWFGAIPVVFMLVGMGGLIGTLRAKGNANNPNAEPERVPLREITGIDPKWSARGVADEDASGSRVLKPASSRLAAVIGIGVFALIWNGLVWFVFLPGTGVFKRGTHPVEWVFFLFLLPFLAIGLVMIGMLFHQIMALFNPKAELTITPGAPRLGEPFVVSWRLTGRTHALRNLKIAVEGREEATYRRGTRTSTDRKVFLTLDAASVDDPARMLEGRANVPLPNDSMPSFQSTNNRIIWSLKVSGEIPRWADLKEEFVIDVRPPSALPPAPIP